MRNDQNLTKKKRNTNLRFKAENSKKENLKTELLI